MTRRRQPTARRWAVRWLLIAFTVAGLGIWAGAHCADGMAAVPAAALNPGVDMPAFAGIRPVAVVAPGTQHDMPAFASTLPVAVVAPGTQHMPAFASIRPVAVVAPGGQHDMPAFAGTLPVAVVAPGTQHDGGDLAAGDHDPGDAAGGCPIATATATTPHRAGATSVHLPAAVRTPPRVTPRSLRQQPQVLAAATLAQIGVSRT